MTTEIAIIINARLAIYDIILNTSLKRKNLKWRDDALWTHHAFTFACVRLNAYRFPVTDKNRITDSLWKVRKISSCDNDKNHTRTTCKFFLWWLLHYSAVQFLLLYYLADMADVTWHSINNCSMLFLEANYTSNSFADTVDSRHRTIVAN